MPISSPDHPRQLGFSRSSAARSLYCSAPGAKDAFWVYESPSEEDASPIAGMLAPWPGRIDVTVDGNPI
jgi:uncharacterized protein (DUF427 family)